jgi:two-component system phosphate regulon sensor histidine kinase PhoR
VDRLHTALSLPRVGFYELSLRRRVLLTQLPLAVTVALLYLGITGQYPHLLAAPPVQWAGALFFVLTAACVLVPWDRLPHSSFLVIPVLDFLPITLLREATLVELTGVGMMAVFPVIWLAASGRLPRLVVPVGVVLTLAMVWVPLFLPGRAVTAEALTRPLLIPFMMIGIGVTVQVLDRSMEKQKAQLEDHRARLEEQTKQLQAKDAQLRGLLAETARRQRLLDTVLDTVDVGVLVIDAAGHDVLMNARQHRIHQLSLPPGVADAAEAQLMLFADGHGTPLPVQDRVAYRAIRGEAFTDELVWAGAPGHQRVLSVSAKPMHDERGHAEGSVLSFHDVTDLVAALEAKDDLLAGVSHELRTPLTSIRGYTELLTMTEDPVEVRAGLEVIERNADQLLALVEDLLATPTSPFTLQRAPVDLVALAHQAVTALGPRAEAAGVTVSIDAPDHLVAGCDRVRLGQVLDNLLTNAVKYSPDGGHVLVHLAEVGETVRCEVVDHGMGMTEQDTQKVFERFHRSAHARMSTIPGLGLGLAVTRDIVEAHGGTITCHSTLGEGATFTITLPTTASAPAHRSSR